MNSSAVFAQTRLQIETHLARRIPRALTPQPRTIVERLPSGMERVDGWMEGGVPVGAISELVGARSSGRSTIAQIFTAATQREDRVVAWVDASDAFDPCSAALNGIDLGRLLWVRCQQAKSQEEAQEQSGGMLVAGYSAPAQVGGGGGPHPRSEGIGMPEAVSSILQAHGGLHDKQLRREKKALGTPGMANRPASRASVDREEQVPTDRRPSRRASDARSNALTPRCSEPLPHRRKTEDLSKLGYVAGGPPVPSRTKIQATNTQPSGNGWAALDRAIRATDLLLQAGGFGLLVLDLGSTPAEMSWRVPLATWFRFRSACQRSRTSLLLLTQHSCARSSAELVVRMEAAHMESQQNVMTGVRFQAEVERQRFATPQGAVVPIRKPAQAERPGGWRGRAPWAV